MKAKDLLVEFYQEATDTTVGYMSSADDDKLSPMSRSKNRRPRLTLRHLNKLRQINQIKRQEQIANLKHISKMYGNPPEE